MLWAVAVMLCVGGGVAVAGDVCVACNVGGGGDVGAVGADGDCVWHASDEEPPYMLLDPLDLVIQLYGDAALATFHLIDGDALSRRSFVLAKRAGDWKIVPLHASNVISSE